MPMLTNFEVMLMSDWPDTVYCYRIAEGYPTLGEFIVTEQKEDVEGIEWATDRRSYTLTGGADD